jgi:hypothetical protein
LIVGLRIGAGFRLGRHVWIGASVPLGHHARRLAAHRGHGEDLGQMLLGLGAMYVIVVVLYKMAFG